MHYTVIYTVLNILEYIKAAIPWQPTCSVALGAGKEGGTCSPPAKYHRHTDCSSLKHKQLTH